MGLEPFRGQGSVAGLVLPSLAVSNPFFFVVSLSSHCLTSNTGMKREAEEDRTGSTQFRV